MRISILICIIASCYSASAYQQIFNPYYNLFRYSYPTYYNSLGGSYASHVPIYSNSYVSSVPQYSGPIASYINHPNTNPTFNVLAELPASIEKSFTVVPMLVVSEDNLNMISNAHIVTVSKKKPTMVIKTDKNVIQCTPAVKIILQTPIIVYNLKTSVLFPTEMTIVHDNVVIPIRVGAVIAPISAEIQVSEDTPVSIEIVYAIPTKPIKVDYVNNEKDVVVDPDAQAVIVDNNESSEQKVPILNFPSVEAEPVVSENEDEELVNRNPPAGIVQSTQPQSSLEVFTNSKESAVLTSLREEAKKKRI